MRRGAETKQQTARRFVGRVTLVTVFFAVLASSLVARAVYLQVLDKDFLNQQADTRHLRTEKISAHRGTITDRNGEPLAISTPVDSIWVNPKEFAPAVDNVPQLARALGIDSQIADAPHHAQHGQGIPVPEAPSQPGTRSGSARSEAAGH